MAKKTGIENKRPSRVLMYFYLFFLLLSVVVTIKIYRIQYSWEPNEKFVKEFLPSKHLEQIRPREGSIMDHNGRILAISTPLYDIYMDCYVQKEHYDKDEKNGKKKNGEWLAKADALSARLAEMFPKKGKDSTYYSNLIRSSRTAGKRYVSIVKGVDHRTVEELKTLPLFNEAQHKGGLIVEPIENRMYPYEGLAKRIIGYVNKNIEEGFIGIEGTYYREIKGTAGTKWAKRTDNFEWISDIDSTSIEAEDGLDIRTTLDIHIQDIADRALRKHIDTVKHINSACVVIMDVETGGVRAMVNLKREKSGKLSETFNMAVARAAEPGSIFKTVMLTALLEDGYVTLDEPMPIDINKMKYPGFKNVERDEYVFRYKDRHKTDFIPVIDGLMISSNYVFRRQVTDHYYSNPEELIARLHSYHMGGSFSFEIKENGGSSPRLPDPESKSWNGATIPSMAIGYSVHVTPLQILSFYNAIANGGKMMKPYIVDRFERDGMLVEERKPNLLSVVCSEATADTLTRALKKVTAYMKGASYQEGTAANSMNGVGCEVAGKTGTAWIYLEGDDAIGKQSPYIAADGSRKYQASFAGFFPADDPKYSMIVVAYTDRVHKIEGGGGRPARVFRDIVNDIMTYDPQWQREITARKDKW
jgi:cell division protein FtsI (penicillin-binding protein 3)